jgi:hypothetical protein
MTTKPLQHKENFHSTFAVRRLHEQCVRRTHVTKKNFCETCGRTLIRASNERLRRQPPTCGNGPGELLDDGDDDGAGDECVGDGDGFAVFDGDGDGFGDDDVVGPM